MKQKTESFMNLCPPVSIQIPFSQYISSLFNNTAQTLPLHSLIDDVYPPGDTHER